MSGLMGLDAAVAASFAATVDTVLSTPWPYNAGHMSLGPDDVDVTPTRLHPAFHASLDWHSSAHMQYSALLLLEHDLAGEHADALLAQLDARLTPEHGRIEAEYLRRAPGFERPYGWGWGAELLVAARRSQAPQAAAWVQALTPIVEQVCDNVLAWLPNLVFPVRTGQHDNTAFGLMLLHDACGELEGVVSRAGEVRAAIGEHARRFYGEDRDYPAAWEPSGNDFMSAALAEAALMRRMLPAAEFPDWLQGFLPRLGEEGDTLLTVPEVRDTSDGKSVHLYGLALARAWLLRELLPTLTELDPARGQRVRAATERQIAETLPVVTGGHFMSTHWLVTFALRAVLAG